MKESLSKRPKALHVITESFSAYAFVKPLAIFLRERGWDSVIACSPQSYADAHSFTAQLRSEGFDVRDVNISRGIEPISDVGKVVEVCRLIRRERPWLVHTHLAKAGVVGRLAARLTGVPCVHTVYDLAFVERRGLRRSVYLGIEQLSASLAHRILFVSENERQLALKSGIGRHDRMVTIGFGIDETLYSPSSVTPNQVRGIKRQYQIPEQRLVVGTVARLVRRKGIDLLLRAAALILARHWDCHLLIAGGGPMRGELMTLAGELGLKDRVSFTGFVDDERKMPLIYSAMDVFCLPSRREGYGMVYAEAGAMEKPVVAPDMPPMNAIVRGGRTGLLVPPENPAAIAEALQRLAGDQSLRIRMGREAREFVHEFCDMRDAWSQVVEAYASALGMG